MYIQLCFSLVFSLVILVSAENITTEAVVMDGEVNVALLVNNCRNSSELSYRKQAIVAAATWTVDRVNFLNILPSLKVRLKIFETCTEADYYRTVFGLYQQDDLLVVVSDEILTGKAAKFAEVLDIPTNTVVRYDGFLVKAAIEFLRTLGWTDNIRVIAPNERLLSEFYKYSKKETVCIVECLVYRNDCPLTFNDTAHYVFFGNEDQIGQFIKHLDSEEQPNVLYVPLDGSIPAGLPYKSYIIMSPADPAISTYSTPQNFHPTPIFFEAAKPILSYALSVEKLLKENCNETSKITCLKKKLLKRSPAIIPSPATMLAILKIEPLKLNFIYHIYRIDNETNTTEVFRTNDIYQSLSRIYDYNIFNNNLTLVDRSFEPIPARSVAMDELDKCKEYFFKRDFMFDNGELDRPITFRTESWVYGFLSLSLLGVIFCISILIFLLICICRRDILEGNPILTLTMLLAVMLLFCSVLPFSLQDQKDNSNSLCVAKSLSITLSYALVFSLLLSRCILLATASKELGFMSHVAGPVQAFLCLFIFGVQAALSLQVVGRCLEIFRGNAFVYLLSYNVMLLLLLLCLCPLIYKCQRNYREGKYFSISIFLVTLTWCIWLPLYATLEEEWREPMLCLGLVCTAGIFLGTVFIPRTYLMTIAAARDKITSAFPSIATAASTMDLYRANTQPIYDCVNIAAINAVAVARASVTGNNLQQPDLYSCRALPDDEDFDFRCDSPTHEDKVTRF